MAEVEKKKVDAIRVSIRFIDWEHSKENIPAGYIPIGYDEEGELGGHACFMHEVDAEYLMEQLQIYFKAKNELHASILGQQMSGKARKGKLSDEEYYKIQDQIDEYKGVKHE